MFKLYSTDDNRQQPWEYLPCGAITPKYGMALRMNAGQLALASGSALPEYICMREEAGSVASGTIIPVIKTQKDQVYETEAPSGLTPGTAYTVAGSGLSITSTASSGVFIVSEQDAADYTVRGRFNI